MVAERLLAWAPEDWPVADDWQPLVSDFFQSEAGKALGQRLQARLDAGAVIYPSHPLKALELTPLKDVRIVILGQDPYHGAGQAEGLAFSVAPGVKLPPSLRNIFAELAQDKALPDWKAPENGSLESWARQGVLLLNTCLTVEDGQPASHAQLGWEVLTQRMIRTVVECAEPTVFMLWGAHAQKAMDKALAGVGADLSKKHLLLMANHPSPLSARRGPIPFLGCGHFGLATNWLRAQGRGEFRWNFVA